MQKVIIALAVIVILALGGWALSRDNSSMTNNSTKTNQTETPESRKPVATNAVTIQNLSYSPASITVSRGTTVKWTNKDNTNHTVTEIDRRDGPNSPPITPGKSYSFTFNQTGIFHYHCLIHPEMTGTVAVMPGNAAQPQSSTPANTTPIQNNTEQGSPY